MLVLYFGWRNMWTGPNGASSRFLLAVLVWQGSLVRFLKKITFGGVILLVFWRLIIIMKEWFCAVWLEVPRALPSLWEKLRQRLSFLPLHQHWHHQAFNTISKISKFKIGDDCGTNTGTDCNVNGIAVKLKKGTCSPRYTFLQYDWLLCCVDQSG